MTHLFFLAWKHLCFHRLRTAALVTSIALVLYVPAALQVIVARGEIRLRTRAETTPLVIGAKGSPLELTLNSLYFDPPPPSVIPVSTIAAIQRHSGVVTVPVYCRFNAQGFRVVGTTLEYFNRRQLGMGSGTIPEELGQCCIGYSVARQLNLDINDTILTSSEGAFDFAGVYPTMLRVVGILEPSDSPDDRAIFVSLETSWIIEGLGHGHDEFTTELHDEDVLSRNRKAAAAHAALNTYREITSENRHSFHFHGDPGTFPITAVLAFPNSDKAGTLLEGEFRNASTQVQIAVPSDVIDRLLNTILTLRSLILIGATVVGLSTIITVVLVFWLALRLRQTEMQTIRRIGCSPGTIPLLIITEVTSVVLMSVIMASALTILTRLLSAEAYWLLIKFAS